MEILEKFRVEELDFFSQYWIFSMIIERSAGPKRVDMAGDDAESPLEAILPPEQPAEQVCLLRDSPFRILRVSRANRVVGNLLE